MGFIDRSWWSWIGHVLLVAVIATQLVSPPVKSPMGVVTLAAQEAHMHTTISQIPKSVRTEHEAIHFALERATKAPGRVGAAARSLAQILHPHFVREEEIALPPLGALAVLSAGQLPADATAILAMTDALRRELPRMLEEHTRIRAAVQTLRREAEAERATQQVQLADQLALHAQSEEEVLYPAAVLVGELIRGRMNGR